MFSAFHFVYRTLRFRERGILSENFSIETPVKSFHAICFKQEGRKKFKGTILVVNGFSVYGHKDERTLNIAKAIACIGFRAVTVAFDDLDSLHINPRTVQEMTLVIKALAQRKALNEKERIAIFAPSYSAGMMLNACADKEVAHLVASLCAVGTYSSIEKSLNFVMNSNDIDDYGRNVMLYNFLPYTDLATTGILKIIKTAIEDNGYKRKKAMLPDVLRDADEADVVLWKKFEKDTSFRRNVLEQAFQIVPQREKWIEAFDVFPKVSRLQASVVFIHGRNDAVIPASESVQLHHHLVQQKKKSHLCITSMLDHGDIQRNISALFEALGLVRAFSRFFKYARQ